MDVVLEKALKHTVISCYFKFYFRQKNRSGRAMRVDPHHPPNKLTILGTALFGLERFECG